jgi:hypothetical protein
VCASWFHSTTHTGRGHQSMHQKSKPLELEQRQFQDSDHKGRRASRGCLFGMSLPGPLAKHHYLEVNHATTENSKLVNGKPASRACPLARRVIAANIQILLFPEQQQESKILGVHTRTSLATKRTSSTGVAPSNITGFSRLSASKGGPCHEKNVSLHMHMQ